MPTRKIQDSSGSSSFNSKADRTNKHIKFYLKTFRRPSLEIESFLNFSNKNVLSDLISRYKLKGIDFGNWASQTMRYNFTLALYTAFFDLNKVLKFNNNIGRGALSIGYGSRGVPKAYAHFEPSINYINLSRERRKDKVGGNNESVREFHSGFGSFAHEYGHFLDYYFGGYSNGRTRSITGGSAILKKIQTGSSPLIFNLESYKDYFQDRIVQGTNNESRILMYEIFTTLFLSKKTYRPTPFYLRTYKFAEDTKSDYWIEFSEIWARLFEVYVSFKLKKLGIVNKFLVFENKGKYASELIIKGKKWRSPVYATFSEIEKVEKLIDKLILTFKN